MAIANITNNILTDSGVTTSSLLPLSGGTLTGALTTTNINIGAGGFDYPNGQLEFTNTTSGGYVGIGTQMLGSAIMYFDHRGTSNTGSFAFRNGSGGGNTLFILSSTGAATFSSSVLATQGKFYSGSSSVVGLIVGGAGGIGTTSQGELQFGDFATIYKIQGGADYTGFNFVIGTTTALKINSSANVGIGTTSPGTQLEVMSTTGGTLRLKRDDTSVTTDETLGTLEFYTNDGDGPHVGAYVRGLGADLSGQNYGRFGALSFGVSKTANNDAVEAMRIDLSGNVGIGTTTPVSKLTLNGWVGASLPYIDGTSKSYNGNGIIVGSNNSGNTDIGMGLNLVNNTSSVGSYSPVISFTSLTSGGSYNATYAFISGIYQGNGADGNWASGDLIFGTGNSYGATERMRITSSGNVGIGVTPVTPSVVTPILQIGTGGAFLSGQGSAKILRSGVNAYYNGSNWIYINTGDVCWAEAVDGEFRWYNAAYGTSGTSFSPTERMRLTNVGRLLLGSPSDNGQLLQINGTSNFAGTMSMSYPAVNVTATTPLYWNGSNGNVGINTSSRRYKTDIVSLSKEQAEIALKLNPVEYTRIETGERELGFIAEEIKDAGLGIIVTEINGQVVTLDYAKVSVIAIAMIKEQQAQIEILKQQVQLLINK